MDRVRNLQEKARTLHTLLTRYAPDDDDAEMVLGFMSDLFKDIEQGKMAPQLKTNIHGTSLVPREQTI